MTETTLLSEADVKRLVDVETAVSAVERTYGEMGRGNVVNPPKLGLELGESGGWPHYNAFMNAMPAYVDWVDTAGLKWAGGFWNNVDEGIPPISGVILLIDPRRGTFRGVVEGAHITALRTGAQTAVGAQHLKPEITSVGIFGAGTQAQYNGLALDTALDLDTVTVFDIDDSAAQEFVDRMEPRLDASVEAAETEPAAAAADLVVTVTTAKEPFLRPEWIDDGTMIAALGSYQELHNETILQTDSIVVDHVEQCLHRGAMKQLAEDGQIGEEDIDETIGSVVADGHSFDSDTVLFVPIGIGALDVALGALALRTATDGDVGETFEFVSLDD